MNTLNLGSEDIPSTKKPNKNRYLKIALGLAAIILIPAVGSTLASSITIGTANSVEFGQGQIATAACDDAIDIKPTSILTSGTFNLNTIVVSGIAPGCDNLYFTLKVLSGSTAQVISNGTNTTLCKIKFTTASAYAVVQDTCGTISGGSSTGFTLAPSATLAASNVGHITIESSST